VNNSNATHSPSWDITSSDRHRPEFQNVPLSIILRDVIPNGSEEEIATLAPREYMSDGALQAAGDYEIRKTVKQIVMLPVSATSEKLSDPDMLPADGFDKMFAVTMIMPFNRNIKLCCFRQTINCLG
jgi:hypothetical protein